MRSYVAAVLGKSFVPRDVLRGRTSDMLELTVMGDRGGTTVLRAWGRMARRLNEFVLVHNIYRFDVDDLDRVSDARRVR